MKTLTYLIFLSIFIDIVICSTSISTSHNTKTTKNYNRKKVNHNNSFSSLWEKPYQQSETTEATGTTTAEATNGDTDTVTTDDENDSDGDELVDSTVFSKPIISNDEEVHNHVTKFIAECNMPTDLGNYRMRSYRYSSPQQNLEPIVMMCGDLNGKEDVLVRVHDQCFTSEVFGSKRCDCKEQLQSALQLIQEQDGVVIYLQQEGRGIGIANKVAAYALQDRGYDTVDANHQLGFKDELREYYAVPDILKDMGIKSIKLLTNNPYKISMLSRLGVKISQRMPIQIRANPFNRKYLDSKKNRMNHLLTEDVVVEEPIPIAKASVSTKKSNSDSKTKPNVSSMNANVASYPSGTDSQEEKREGTTSYIFGKETVEAAIVAIRNGKSVIVVDDENRENEGDLILAAATASDEEVGFMVRHSSGVICVSLEGERLDELQLPPMVVNNEDPKQTAYSISVDYKYNTTTGISAADRALTFRKLADPSVGADAFQRPGHVFPLRYVKGGVLQRGGHTEASLDLSRLAGLAPGGVLAEIVRDDGSLKRLPELREMAVQYGLVLTSVQDIKAYRIETGL